jgi:serine/threonine protein kinase
LPEFTASNVLLRISSFDGLTEDQVLNAFGEPWQVKVVTATGETPCDPTAPRYLVEPLDFYDVDSHFITNEACIIDFGESFEVSSPPKDLGIPQAYCSPELVLDKAAGVESDLWALGCTLFEIRTGRKLFHTFDGDVDDHIYMMVIILGKLPEPWLFAWEAHKDSFEEEPDSEGRAMKTNEFTKETQSPTGRADIPEPRSIRDPLARGLVATNYGSMRIRQHHRDISKNEIVIFADLLGKILKNDPRERLSAVEVLDHEWFKMCAAVCWQIARVDIWASECPGPIKIISVNVTYDLE